MTEEKTAGQPEPQVKAPAESQAVQAGQPGGGQRRPAPPSGRRPPRPGGQGAPNGSTPPKRREEQGQNDPDNTSQKPAGPRPAGQRPPGQRPPGQRPPGQRPPGQRPPGQRPEGPRPSGQPAPAEQRPAGQRPPGQRPPGQRPPGQRPPGERPQGERPPGQPRPKQGPPGPRPEGQGPRPGQPPRRPGTPPARPPQRKPVEPPKPPEEPEETLLQYRVHKLKEQPGKSALVIVAMIAIAGVAFSAYPSPFFGAVSIAILMFSISFFLFPVKYRFTNKGAYMKNLVTNEYRGWDRFYDYFVYKDAVLLSFDYRTIRGRVQKGYLIYFDPEREHKEQLLEIVKSKIKKPEVPYTEKRGKKQAKPAEQNPEQK